jgi:hypothetical protein
MSTIVETSPLPNRTPPQSGDAAGGLAPSARRPRRPTSAEATLGYGQTPDQLPAPCRLRRCLQVRVIKSQVTPAPGWIQTEMGGSDAPFTVEECIPLVADMLEKNHGKAGLRFVDRFDKTLPW